MNQRRLDRIADTTAIAGVSITALLLVLSWNHLPDMISAFDDAHDFQPFEKGQLVMYFVISCALHIGLYCLSRLPRLLVQPWLITNKNRISQFKIARRSHFFLRIQLVLLFNGVIIGDILVALEQMKELYVVTFEKLVIVSMVIVWGFYTYRACRCQ